MAASSAALSMSGVAILAPKQSSDAAALFEGLGAKFGIHASVVSYLVKDIGLGSLEDFLFTFANEALFAEVVASVEGLTVAQKMLQAGRLRQAWQGAKDAEAAAQLFQKRGDEDPDLDTLLGKKDLENLEDLFWARYHHFFSAMEDPSDALVSRLHREIARRTLTVREVWKVSTMAVQQKGEKKRTEIGDNLTLLQDASDEPSMHTVRSTQSYLARLWTLMLGYAKAGCEKRPNAPDDGEPRGSCSVR